MNNHMTLATHILGMVAHIGSTEARPATSEELAQSFGTNAVVVRRMTAVLRDAGLVQSKRGKGGGTVLAHPPSKITLRHIYEAITQNVDACQTKPLLMRRSHEALGPHCLVAPALLSYLDEVYSDAEEALLQKFQAITLEHLYDEVSARVVRQCGPHD